MTYLALATNTIVTDCKGIREHLMATELQPPLILEIETENFVGIVGLLSCHGYRVVSRPENPSRHRVIDELPELSDETGAA